MQKNSLRLAVLAVALTLSACSTFSDKSESKDTDAAKLYADAVDEMSSGSYATAIKQFERLESLYPFGVYAQQAQMDIAYSNYKQGDHEEALAAADRFIKLHPNHPNVDYIYYLRGLINFNERSGALAALFGQDPTERDPKAARESFDAFKQLVDRFPNSKYAPDAIARMQYLLSALAQYELHVAKYYYRRGAYVAAANRAQTVVKEFNNTPPVEEALYMMMRSYDQLNLPVLRDDAKRVLVQNFPNSRFLKNGDEEEKKWWKFW